MHVMHAPVPGAERVMSQNESCHTLYSEGWWRWSAKVWVEAMAHVKVRHVTYERVMSHINESFHTLFGGVVQVVGKGVRRVNVTFWFVTCEQVMSNMDESCHILFGGVVQAVGKSVSRVSITYEWSISHTNKACRISMSHVTHCIRRSGGGWQRR